MADEAKRNLEGTACHEHCLVDGFLSTGGLLGITYVGTSVSLRSSLKVRRSGP